MAKPSTHDGLVTYIHVSLWPEIGSWSHFRCRLRLHPRHFWPILGICPPMDRVSALYHSYHNRLFVQVDDNFSAGVWSCGRAQRPSSRSPFPSTSSNHSFLSKSFLVLISVLLNLIFELYLHPQTIHSRVWEAPFIQFVLYFQTIYICMYVYIHVCIHMYTYIYI